MALYQIEMQKQRARDACASIADTLPDRPSELLGVAIDDAYGLDRRMYNVDWREYHTGSEDSGLSRCACVCFAGAVMAGRLGAPSHLTITPRAFEGVNDSLHCKLEALERFRESDIKGGLYLLGYGDTKEGLTSGERIVSFTNEQRALVEERDGDASEWFEFYDWGEFELFLEDMSELRAGFAKVGL